jgi:hypothetical protein
MRRAALVTAFFAALAFVHAWPLSGHPGRVAFDSGGDTRLFLWTIGWNLHALGSPGVSLFDANIFHPQPNTLAYSENLLGLSLLAAPVRAAGGDLLLSLNAATLASLVLCGAGGAFLGRELGLGWPGALAVGTVYAFAPPRLMRLGQPHLLALQWIPFCLGYAHRYLRTGRRRSLWIAAGFFVLQAATSGHGGVFLALALALLALYRLALRRGPGPRRLAADLAAPALLAAGASALLFAPYLRAAHEAGLRRDLAEARAWSPNAASFVASPAHAHRAVLGSRAERAARAYLFPGFLPLALSLLAVWRGRAGAPGDAGFYLALGVVSLWTALGPDFGLFTALHRWLPGFGLIRVPSRLFNLTMVALGVGAGCGVQRLPRPALRAAAVALLGLEFLAVPLDARPYDVEVPPVDRWLASQPGRFAVIELPVADPRDEPRASSLQSRYVLHSTAHWQRTVNGYSGHTPAGHDQLFRTLARFPDDASFDALQRLDVRYVVVHRGNFPPGDWPAVEAALARRGLERRAQIDGDLVLALP